MSDSTVPDAGQPLQDIPGMNALGWGYDVIRGRYADPASTTMPVYDLSQDTPRQIRVGPDSVYNIPSTVAFQPIRTSDISVCSGTTIEDHQKSLALRAGLSGTYGAFGGELDVGFDHTAFSKTQSTFVTCIDAFNLWRLRLPTAVSKTNATSALTNAYNALEAKATPKDPAAVVAATNEFFRTYGTHYLQEIIVGARAQYKCTVDTSKFGATTGLATSAKASYAFATATAGVTASSTVTNFNSASTTFLKTAGGDEALAHDIVNGKYGAWLASVDSYPVFVDFTPASLRPIWCLLGIEDDDDPSWLAALDTYARDATQIPSLFTPPTAGQTFILRAQNEVFLNAPNKDDGWVRVAAPHPDTAVVFSLQDVTPLHDPKVVGDVATVRLKAETALPSGAHPYLQLYTLGDPPPGGALAFGADIDTTDNTVFYLNVVQPGPPLQVALGIGEDTEHRQWFCRYAYSGSQWVGLGPTRSQEALFDVFAG